MARAIGIGNQDFEVIRNKGYFYIDKTRFIKDWWESGDSAVWSLLLASGYLRAVHYEFNTLRRKAEFDLKLTNLEMEYQTLLAAKGVRKDRIRKYRVAFCGKKVLIGSASKRVGITGNE